MQLLEKCLPSCDSVVWCMQLTELGAADYGSEEGL